jgi:hypothetical protein
VDFDALGGDGVSNFFGHDGDGRVGSPDPLYRVNPNAGTASFVRSLDANFFIRDLTVADGNIFYIGPGFLATTDLDGNNLMTQQLSLPGDYSGIAVVDNPSSVPSVPGPLPLFGVGAAFGMSRKMRRRIASSKSSPHVTTIQ